MLLHFFGLLVTVWSMAAASDAVGSSSSSTAPLASQIQRENETLSKASSSKAVMECKCVPYYLCNSKFSLTRLIGCDLYEVCCDNPIDPSELNLKSDPKRLSRSVPQMPLKSEPKTLKACGYRNPEGIGASVAGASTQFGEFPWVIALLNRNSSEYIGAGVLINPEVVITVAHYAQKYTPEGLKIRAGEWETQSTEEPLEHQERNVQEIYIHQDFISKKLQNNIALIRLERPLELAEHINVICLPEQDESFDSHEKCIANGWGKQRFGNEGIYKVILEKVELNMVANDRCNMMLKKTRVGPKFELHNSFLCAGGEGQNNCKADEGAALACPISNDRYTLTGLVAWGIGCGQKNSPAVYTNVPKFIDWINQKMAHWGLDVPSYTTKTIN